ncbi:MAG: diguanylate cyclase [Gammaproteobacteria bacterium]
MDLLAFNFQSGSSPFAAQLREGFANLRFRGFLEREFRELLVRQNLVRSRIASLILLAILAAVSILDWAASGSPVVELSSALRFGVILPGLVLLVLATWHPALQQHYTRIAAVSVTLLGFVVIYDSQVAAAGEDSYIALGLILVILYVFYACLFPGLRFRVSTTIGVALVTAYLALGLSMDVVAQQLSYSTAMLVAAVMLSGLASYNFEFVLRTSFLETRLLNEIAERDGLTGLYNRRMFDDLMSRIWRQSQRENMPLEIVLVDIDYFKIFNDLYGHQAGDDCLRKVAACIANSANRPFDFAARYGGEEFVLVLCGPPGERESTVGEQIRLDIMNLRIPHQGSAIDSVITVSVGVAIASCHSGRSLAGTIQVADEALYEAKLAGRNRLICRDTAEVDMETGVFRTGIASRRLA